jgi:hypothetical protein
MAEYQSLARQERIKQLLDCITFEEFVQGSGTHTDHNFALDKLKKRIVKMTQQCSPDFRGVEHQLAHLRRAVIGKPWSEFPLQTLPPYDDLNKLVAALGASIQHDATKAARVQESKHHTTLPTFFENQMNLRNPTYGRTSWERGRLIPSHTRRQHGTPDTNMKRRSSFVPKKHIADRRGHVRHRTWVNEQTGLLKPDSESRERTCNRCGGRDHLSFEIERCDPQKSKHHIATRFASGDAMEDVFMDVLDYQLTPEELLELGADTENNGDGDTSPVEQNDFAAAFVDAYETRFTSHLGNRLSHPEEEE